MPTSLQASNGTLWAAWQSNRLTPLIGRSDIFYKTMTGGVWSASINLTTPNIHVNNADPALAQMGNGTVTLFWSANITGIYKIYFERYNPGGWSPIAQLTTGTTGDCSSSAATGRNGTLWLFWTRGTPCTTGTTQIFYKTLKGNVWSVDTQLTFDAAQNLEAKAMVAKDGRVWVVFAKFVNANKNDQVFDIVFNGASWSPQTQLISSNLFDDHPDIMQDRNGTIWVFWTREIPITASDFDDKLYNIFSTDNGGTWSSPSQMTFDPSCCQINDWGPSAVQAVDHTIWLFYSSSLPLGGNFDLYYLESNAIFPIHDVDVSRITAGPACSFPLLAPSSPVCLFPGGLKSVNESSIVSVNVTVTDTGDFPESVTVQLTAQNTTTYGVGSATVTLNPGGSSLAVFKWNTTSTMKPGRYGLNAIAPPVAGETIGNQADNSLLANNVVHLVPLGDVDLSGIVSFQDAAAVAYAFQSTPASSRWNPYADINGDGVVDFLDVSTMAINYGIPT